MRSVQLRGVGCKLTLQLLAASIADEGSAEAVVSQRTKGGAIEIERGRDGVEVLVHIAAEIGGIVRIHGNHQPGFDHPAQWMRFNRRHAAKAKIGQRAHCQHHPLIGQAPDQLRVLKRPVAMIEAVDAEFVQRFPNIFGRPFLAGMRNKAKTFAAGPGEHSREFRWRVTQFGGIETHADDAIAVGQRLIATAALKAGAGLLVVAESRLPALGRITAPMIVVPDVMVALEAVGVAARARAKAKIIGVTGSVGKTTTKEALRCALESRHQCRRSKLFTCNSRDRVGCPPRTSCAT